MTSRERLLAVLRGELPDCVPVCPDISNMVPCRLTGKPFWELYAFQDPPLWKAHIDALKRFDIDGGFEVFGPGPAELFGEAEAEPRWEERVVHRYPDGRFVTRHFSLADGTWTPGVKLYTADNSPVSNVPPAKLGLPETLPEWEPLEGVREWPRGMALWRMIREELGEQGAMGLSSGCTTCVLHNEGDVYAYYEDPAPFFERRDRMIADIERRMPLIAAMDPRPDFLACGGSGTLIWQTPAIFRELGLPVLKRVTELARDAGIPTQVHSCGPEAALVRMAAEETVLTVIDPLEVPPMGDCDLAALKAAYGDRLVLKGNLHTTDVMLRGSADDVTAASRKAIDDAAAGGRFILSTGDQCGRDTPDDNIRAMVETARTYGKY